MLYWCIYTNLYPLAPLSCGCVLAQRLLDFILYNWWLLISCADIWKFCSPVQKKVLDEIVDRDVEKGVIYNCYGLNMNYMCMCI